MLWPRATPRDDKPRPSSVFSAWRIIKMTALFKPLAFSPCADCAKIAAGIPKAINAQNASLSLICRCQLGQSAHQVFCPLDATPRQGRREREPRRHQLPKGEMSALSHSIISSARFCIDCGTVIPSAFAVLRFISSSILLACWTGKSAGFSPLRTRPTYPPARR